MIVDTFVGLLTTLIAIFCLQGFLQKLKEHLLPRMGAVLGSKRDSPGNNNNATHDNNLCSSSIIFKHDRIYSHSLMRINHTTYDVRRSQDVINPSTSHCHVMLFASSEHPDSSPSHPFKYAQVLGIYHVNAMYIGPGMIDYEAHKFEFLWVRWFQPVDTGSTGWSDRKVDRVQFPPIARGDAFDFIDPADVLRSCHIIPRFAKGQLHSDGKGLSTCARDSADWVEYYVGR